MSERADYQVTITAQEQAELLATERDSTPLAPNEVTGRTVATLVSPGTELAAAYLGTRFPSFPGYAACFEVEEVGSEVTDLRPDDPVFCMGPHRSWQRARREDVLPLPQGLAPEEAVFARMMGVTMSTLTTTTARPPATVLVTGLGLVGNLGAQVFQACGYPVIACDPVDARRKISLEAGIGTVLPSVPVDDPAVVGEVALVLECSGHEQAALDGCNVVQKRGEVVLVASYWAQRTDLSAHELLRTVFQRYVVLRSGWEWQLPGHAEPFRKNSIFDNFRAALDWLAQGRVRVSGLAAKVPPREANRVYQELLHRRGEYLTAVFNWSDCP